MFATALIVFRETLEAALFVGIVAAATRGLPGRVRWLSGGVVLGVMGALGLAAGAEYIGAWADGIGQDLVNASILGVAFAMLAWHCIWVSTHGHEMSRDASDLGSSVNSGTRPPWALVVAVGLSVLREGAETVLFVAGLATGAQASARSMVPAAAIGIAGGSLLGLLIYLGLSRVKPQRLFQITNALILVLAAAIASQLAKALAQSGVVATWTSPIWDTSAVLTTDSALGSMLHALAGYDAQPSGLQVLFYVGALLLISAGTWLVRRGQHRQRPLPALRPIAHA